MSNKKNKHIKINFALILSVIATIILIVIPLYSMNIEFHKKIILNRHKVIILEKENIKLLNKIDSVNNILISNMK